MRGVHVQKEELTVGAPNLGGDFQQGGADARQVQGMRIDTVREYPVPGTFFPESHRYRKRCGTISERSIPSFLTRNIFVPSIPRIIMHRLRYKRPGILCFPEISLHNKSPCARTSYRYMSKGPATPGEKTKEETTWQTLFKTLRSRPRSANSRARYQT
jgi:hypothetical protein